MKLEGHFPDTRFSAVSAIALSVLLTGCKAKGTDVIVTPGPGGSNTTVVGGLPTKAGPTAGNEVAEVKAMITEMRSIKTPQQMPEFFTNESAAAMGMVMMIPVAMMAAFEDMGSQMGQELSKLGGQGQAQTPPPASQAPKVKADLEATLKKYGISKDIKPDDKQAMAALTGRGREFFGDMLGLLTKLDKKGGSGFDMDPNKTPDPADATYEVLSPTRVKINQKTPKDKMMEKLEARFEDGRWRLHMGGIEDMVKQMGPAMGGMPGGPGGMGMPSGPGMPGAPR